MAQVLGFIVRSVLKNYQTMCRQLNAEPKIASTGAESISSLRRYDWAKFAHILTEITAHLRELGIEPAEFQRRLSPTLFKKMYGIRYSSLLFSPKNLLKMIDTFAGPFLFRCGTSEFNDLENSRINIVIQLFDNLQDCKAFFEHCAAGMLVQLDSMGFKASSIENCEIAERFLNVTFFLENDHSRMLEDIDAAKCVPDNFRFLLDDFINHVLEGDFDTISTSASESLDQLLSLSKTLPHRESTIDSLTIISSRIQLALSKGLEKHEGKLCLKIAKSECRALQSLVSQSGDLTNMY